jgi:hypothetical protein
MCTQVVCCGLRHGIELRVGDVSGELSARHIVSFMADALAHFRQQSSVLKTQLYTGGPFAGTAKKGTRTLGTFELNYPGGILGDHQSAAIWLEAVVHGHGIADILVQMCENREMFRDRDNATGGGMKIVIELLDQPGRLSKALKALTDLLLARDQELGTYVPGLTRLKVTTHLGQYEGIAAPIMRVEATF